MAVVRRHEMRYHRRTQFPSLQPSRVGRAVVYHTLLFPGASQQPTRLFSLKRRLPLEPTGNVPTMSGDRATRPANAGRAAGLAATVGGVARLVVQPSISNTIARFQLSDGSPLDLTTTTCTYYTRKTYFWCLLLARIMIPIMGQRSAEELACEF